jgi:hypothetical protein
MAMKSKVLEREMFAKPLSKVTRNSGIMEGFEDDDEYDSEDNRGVEELPPMARTPQNPEILMNNLRGDMRSTDARYQELAEMVGEDAAYNTPPEVLAMLQPTLAAQQGIGALGAGPMMPPGGMPMPAGPGPAAGAMPPPMPEMPAEMPPQMPPEMAAGPGPAPMQLAAGGIATLVGGDETGMPGTMSVPQQFRHGGIVQHFKDGSDEEGVTPAASYPPALVQAAQQWAQKMATQQPAAVPDLRTTMAAKMPVYQELLGLGRSREDMKTQMLLDIASRGLGFAGNVDEQGRPLRGSFASRLGQVTRTLPNTMMALAAEQRKGELATKQLALQAAEKEIGDIRELNAKAVESQRKLFGDILKESAKASGQSPFGKGDWHWAVVNRPGFLASYAAGKTTPEQDNLIESAITVLNTPRQELRTDPVTQQTTQVTVQPMVPDFVTAAQEARRRLNLPTGAARAPAPAGAAPAKAPAAGPSAAPAPAEGRMPEEGAPPKMPGAAYISEGPTLFNLAKAGTGPINVGTAFVARVPIAGELIDDPSQPIQAGRYLSNAANRIGRAFATNPRFAEGERRQIQEELNLLPGFIDRPEAYQQRLIGLDSLLLDLRRGAYREGYLNRNLGPDTIKAGRQAVEEIDRARELLGVPPRVTSKEQFDKLPAGPFLLMNKNGTFDLRMKLGQ